MSIDRASNSSGKLTLTIEIRLVCEAVRQISLTVCENSGAAGYNFLSDFLVCVCASSNGWSK